MDSIHVDYPSLHIFLCGGYYDSASQNITSMRSAFCQIIHSLPCQDYDLLIAEDVSKEFQARQDTYDNLLSLESDLAQLSNIIILFSESFGSAVELGAFCWDENIPQRLLVFISEKYYEDTSFVKLGPLKHLEKKCSKVSVCVLPRKVCDLVSLNNKQSTEINNFQRYISEAFTDRIKSIETRTTFNENYRGHIILFLCGIVWYYHALNKDEIWYIASECKVDIEEADVDKYMFCSIILGWVKIKTVASRDYYVSVCEKSPLSFKQKPANMIKKDAWKVDILKVWEKHDRYRYDAIRSARQS
ncbi:MAG: retron St85 family effector protein [Acetobacter orientalis]|uniref:retron St85 family effector protein n=1 Tax=Acetobacter orientalis TaxID=146474 RepID=UPI0039EBD822